MFEGVAVVESLAVTKGAYAHGSAKVDPVDRVAATIEMVGLGPPPAIRAVVAAVGSGQRTVVDVVDEMLGRVEVAHRMTNAVVSCIPHPADPGTRCTANPLADTARAAAAAADKIPLSDRGPLHGLPLSVKECFLLQGTDSTIGLGKFKSVGGVDRRSKVTAPLIEALVDAGAIPICKTNVPQIMYAWECQNPVYGRTTCPSSELFIPGGSSGGEGALIGAGGSIVGLGSDIGGSCRVPAAMGGCSGIKPTMFRLAGAMRSQPCVYGAQTALASCPGVLARSADDIAALMAGVLTKRGHDIMRKADPHVVPLLWNDAEFISTRKLRVGYYVDDGYMTATPACQRAVRVAVEALRADGHHVEVFELEKLTVKVPVAIQTFMALVSSGTEHIVAAMAGETQAPFLRKLMAMARISPQLPHTIKARLLPWVVRNVLGGAYQSELLPIIGAKSTTDYYEALHAQRAFSAGWTEQIAKQDLDVVVCPVNVLPTATPETTGDYVQAASYCFLANLLDVTAGVSPICRLDPKADAATDAFWGKVHNAGDTVTLGPLRKAYDAAIGSGLALPLGVQVIGKPFTEELVLRTMAILERGGEFADSDFSFAK